MVASEMNTLTPEEHVEVIRHVVDVAGHRVPVIAGTGSNSTREAIEFTSEARRAGADGALLISPYYNKPTQDGIFHHYRTIAEQTGLPLLVYNIPGRTASRIEPDTIARLSRVDGIVGLKEAGGDLVKSAETMARADPAFDVLSGDEALTLPLLARGGRGRGAPPAAVPVKWVPTQPMPSPSRWVTLPGVASMSLFAHIVEPPSSVNSSRYWMRDPSASLKSGWLRSMPLSITPTTTPSPW